jgi:hypothetical protein
LRDQLVGARRVSGQHAGVTPQARQRGDDVGLDESMRSSQAFKHRDQTASAVRQLRA